MKFCKINKLPYQIRSVPEGEYQRIKLTYRYVYLVHKSILCGYKQFTTINIIKAARFFNRKCLNRRFGVVLIPTFLFNIYKLPCLGLETSNPGIKCHNITNKMPNNLEIKAYTETSLRYLLKWRHQHPLMLPAFSAGYATDCFYPEDLLPCHQENMECPETKN